MRELKARAALEGVKLKDYFANLVQTALQRPPEVGLASERSAAPVFRRTSAKPMPALSNADLNAMMDLQDASIRGVKSGKK